MILCNWPCELAAHPAVTQQSASVWFPACPSVSEPRCLSTGLPHLYSPLHRTRTNPCCPAEGDKRKRTVAWNYLANNLFKLLSHEWDKLPVLVWCLLYCLVLGPVWASCLRLSQKWTTWSRVVCMIHLCEQLQLSLCHWLRKKRNWSSPIKSFELHKNANNAVDIRKMC